MKKYIPYIAIIAAVFILAAYVSAYWFQLMLIQGESMSPTYSNLSLVVLDKHFNEGDILEGNVIAFRCNGLNSNLVKRVVAVPGQTIVISDGTLYVDGKVPSFYDYPAFEFAGILSEEITLGEGEYIVIGDNISESKDSRYDEVGIVSFEDVFGIVIDS